MEKKVENISLKLPRDIMKHRVYVENYSCKKVGAAFDKIGFLCLGNSTLIDLCYFFKLLRYYIPCVCLSESDKTASDSHSLQTLVFLQKLAHAR